MTQEDKNSSERIRQEERERAASFIRAWEVNLHDLGKGYLVERVFKEDVAAAILKGEHASAIRGQETEPATPEPCDCDADGHSRECRDATPSTQPAAPLGNVRLCEMDGPRTGWRCSLPKGHDGGHSAHGGHEPRFGEVLETWPATPPTQPEGERACCRPNAPCSPDCGLECVAAPEQETPAPETTLKSHARLAMELVQARAERDAALKARDEARSRIPTEATCQGCGDGCFDYVGGLCVGCLRDRLDSAEAESSALRKERDRLAQRYEALLTEAKKGGPLALRVKAAEAHVSSLQGALGPDLAGREFGDLLSDAAKALDAAGGGPLVDCLRAKSEQVRAALSSLPSEPALTPGCDHGRKQPWCTHCDSRFPTLTREQVAAALKEGEKSARDLRVSETFRLPSEMLVMSAPQPSEPCPVCGPSFIGRCPHQNRPPSEPERRVLIIDGTTKRDEDLRAVLGLAQPSEPEGRCAGCGHLWKEHCRKEINPGLGCMAGDPRWGNTRLCSCKAAPPPPAKAEGAPWVTERDAATIRAARDEALEEAAQLLEQIWNNEEGNGFEAAEAIRALKSAPPSAPRARAAAQGGGARPDRPAGGDGAAPPRADHRAHPGRHLPHQHRAPEGGGVAMARCEWNPKHDVPACADGDGDCENEATLAVGVDDNWHLCQPCSERPAFRWKRSRVPLRPAPSTKPGGEG